jgi:transposase-like protein
MALIKLLFRSYNEKKHLKKHFEIVNDSEFVKIRFNNPSVLKIPKTKANIRLLIVLLRLFYSIIGKPYFTFQDIADIVGLKERRNVENFFREFKQKGYDFLQYLSRKVSLAKWVEAIEKIVVENPFLSVEELFEYFKNKNPLIKISFPSFTKYLSQANSCRILQAVHKKIAKGTCEFNQNELFSYLLELQDDPVVKKKIKSMDTERAKKQPEKREPTLKLETQNKAFLVWFFIGAGLNYKIISLIMGYSTSYIQKLANNILKFRDLLLSSISNYSGKICVDEKYVKLEGVWRYVFSAVDAVTGFPLLVEYFPTKTAQSWQLFFTMFKKHYPPPSLIISDGCLALNAGRIAIFPNVPHQYCKFHVMKNLIQKLFESMINKKEILNLICKLKQVFSRETVGARKKAFNELENRMPENIKEYFALNVKSIWKHLTKSLTNNKAERWNRKIKKIVSGKYGLKTPETIRQLVYCLWFKEMIMNSKNHINPETIISKINMTKICQENIANTDLEHYFSLHCA